MYREMMKAKCDSKDWKTVQSVIIKEMGEDFFDFGLDEDPQGHVDRMLREGWLEFKDDYLIVWEEVYD